MGKRDRTPHPAWRAWWALVGVLVVVAETGALRSVMVGDTLSETIWWAYGPTFGLRWWLLGCTVSALLVWAAVHFMWPSVGWRALVGVEVVALAVATGGWLLTR